MKIAVIVSDFGAAMHMGANVETSFKTFDLPPDIAEYVAKCMRDTTTVSLVIEATTPPPAEGEK
jgi:hypothetical protein